MSDQTPDLTADSVSAEAAQGAVEPDSSTGPAPWGDDFTPERAWQTITHLRGREKELENPAKAFQRLASGEDPDAFYELAARYGVEFEDAAEEPEYDAEADAPMTVGQFEAWQQEQQRQAHFESQWSGFGDYVRGLANEAGVELNDKDIRNIAFDCEGRDGLPVPPDKAKQVFDTFMAGRQEYDQGVVDRYLKSKRAPTPPPSGTAGEAQFDRTAANDVQRRAHRRQQIAARLAAAQDQT